MFTITLGVDLGERQRRERQAQHPLAAAVHEERVARGEDDSTRGGPLEQERRVHAGRQCQQQGEAALVIGPRHAGRHALGEGLQ